MKSARRTNRKKTTLKVKDLKTNKDPRAGVKPNRPNRDGLWTNHNEVFLADVS